LLTYGVYWGTILIVDLPGIFMSNIKEKLTQEQIELFEKEDEDIDYDDLVFIPGNKVHAFTSLPSAWANEYGELVFLNVSHKDQVNFIYYIGAEHEASLKTRYLKISIWENINEDRLERFINSAE
jgi:hypothetical protein